MGKGDDHEFREETRRLTSWRCSWSMDS